MHSQPLQRDYERIRFENWYEAQKEGQLTPWQVWQAARADAMSTGRDCTSTQRRGSTVNTEERQTTIIEVNGVKLEVDLRTAKRVDTLRIGVRVKCLVKGYSNDMTTYAGVVVGFEPFPSLPSIVVAYIDPGYSSGTLKFKTFNAQTKDFEVVADIDNNALEVDRDHIITVFGRDMEKKRMELKELEEKLDFFLAHFGRYFVGKVDA